MANTLWNCKDEEFHLERGKLLRGRKEVYKQNAMEQNAMVPEFHAFNKKRLLTEY